MCVKLLPKYLNLDSYFSHPTNTYTYGVTITPKAYDGICETFVLK